MATEQEEKPVEEEDNALTGFWEKLNSGATNDWKLDFEQLIKSDQVEYDGIIYKYVPVKVKNANTIENLRLEAPTIDQKKDWDKYKDNIMQRACILIEGMTPEKFEDSIYADIEDIVSAWSVRSIRGFRRRVSRTPNGVPDGSQS